MQIIAVGPNVHAATALRHESYLDIPEGKTVTVEVFNTDNSNGVTRELKHLMDFDEQEGHVIPKETIEKLEKWKLAELNSFLITEEDLDLLEALKQHDFTFMAIL